MKKTLLLSTLFSSVAWGNMHLAPPDFNDVIFVDFKTAEYDMNYDLANKVTTVKSKIVFEATKSGKPLFDLVAKPTSVRLDGVVVKQKEVELPGKSGEARIADLVVSPGMHVLEVENEITTNVSYADDGRSVSSAFWIRDLKARMFLEQYIPSNFEYDQYQMTLNLAFKNTKSINQEFFTNGRITRTSPTTLSISFPEYYTVSCPYFHTAAKGAFRVMTYDYKSISGKMIPIKVYTPHIFKTSTFLKKAKTIMAELETDYGAWGHDGLVAYQTMPGTGGMEHSGATATSLAALDHEMLHSYFAKGVMPANGNSGWIDEAIASWRDKGYERHPLMDYKGSNLGSQSDYKRNTDDRAYKLGNSFMAHLDYQLQNVGGLKAFLRGYFATYNHTVINQLHFKNNLEFFSGLNLTSEFETFIWGSNEKGWVAGPNPVHHDLSAEELKKLL